MNGEFIFDSKNWNSILATISRIKDCASYVCGTIENDEIMLMSVDRNGNLHTKAFQEDDVVRHHVYHPDTFCVETIFET